MHLTRCENKSGCLKGRRPGRLAHEELERREGRDEDAVERGFDGFEDVRFDGSREIEVGGGHFPLNRDDRRDGEDLAAEDAFDLNDGKAHADELAVPRGYDLLEYAFVVRLDEHVLMS